MPIEIEKPSAETARPPAVASQQLAAAPFSIASMMADDAHSVDVVEDGIKTSLLCVSDSKRADAMSQVLQELDFYVVKAPDATFALGKLNHNHYDLIVLDEAFDVKNSAGNLVLQHVQFLPMHLRRQFFLCLLSESMPTLDPMLGFKSGVNMVLNARDLDKSKIILARTMKEHRVFYNLFNMELTRKGQI
jgi:CheY-like chemotaxis protein